MSAHAKFCTGLLLRNRNTKEDGLVTRVYQNTERGETMYQVAVPIGRDTWAGRHLVSDWAENALELSNNALLRASDNPPRAGRSVTNAELRIILGNNQS
jgi:hypothetical protein